MVPPLQLQALPVAGSAPNGLNVALGVGDGTFEAWTEFSTGHTATGLWVGDINGDGYVDADDFYTIVTRKIKD